MLSINTSVTYYLEQADKAYAAHDYHIALDYYKKMMKIHKFPKKATAKIYINMMTCAEKLNLHKECYIFAEEMCKQELSFETVALYLKLYSRIKTGMVYQLTYEKVKQLTAKNLDEKKQLISFYEQCKAFKDVEAYGLEYLKLHPKDVDINAKVLVALVEQNKYDEVENFIETIKERKLDIKINFYLAVTCKKLLDFESTNNYLLSYLNSTNDKEKKDNIYLDALSHMVNGASWCGTLDDDAYIYWMRRFYDRMMPDTKSINICKGINNNYNRKMRIGFMSYDFNSHVVGIFIASLFITVIENTSMEIYCYYTNPLIEDQVTKDIQQVSNVFKNVGLYADEMLEKELLQDKLDILFDLNGYTVGSKNYLLAKRFAPVQIIWLASIYSCCTYNLDYMIGDYFLDPIDGETERFTTEKALRLESCFMCYPFIVDNPIEPEPPQIKNGYISFGVVQQHDKFSELSIKTWQRCLEAVPNSRLLLQYPTYNNDMTMKYLVKRLKRFGLDMERVDISALQGKEAYLDFHNRCDIMLETFPFAGGTTTVDAIMMGVPVIGCQYYMRHGRGSFSLMSNVGLGHLCADSIETYHEKVREVAQNIVLLKDLRKNLRSRLKDTPLFNKELFRQSFENAMHEVYLKHCYENKVPFDADYYDGNEVKLIWDCIRASDILKRQSEKDPLDSTFIISLINEYIEMHSLLLEKLFDIYKEDASKLKICVQMAEMIELLASTDDLFAIVNIAQMVRVILLKYI